MKRISLVAALCGFAAAANAQVVINEFAYDDTGVDSIEYVELYNAGASAVDISGWTVVGIDLAPTADSTATVPAATNLAAGGYYVFGMTAVTPKDVDIETNADFQNDMEALILSSGAYGIAPIVDTVAYERNKGNVILPLGAGEPAFDGVSATSGGGIWSNAAQVEGNVTNLQGFTTPTSANSTLVWARITDGYDTGNNELDFGLQAPTPGAANNSLGTVTLPYTNNFTDADNTLVAAFKGNYANGYVQDPATADTLLTAYPVTSQNPSVIPASPEGGNVLMIWDETGGGNSGILNLAAPVADIEVETFFYVSAPLTGADVEISEPIIVRGRPDSAANTLPPALGTTGVHFRVLNNTDGASTPANTAAVTIQVNQIVNGTITTFGTVNSVATGWTRLYLKVVGTDVTAVVGGTYGSGIASGTVITGTTTITRAGGIGFNYREGIAAAGNPGVRPLTYDRLTVQVPPSNVQDWSAY